MVHNGDTYICFGPIFCSTQPNFPITHHAHFGEVEQSVIGEVGRSLLDEAQLGEVHAQVGDAGRVAAVQRVAQVTEVALERDQLLEPTHRLLRLVGGDVGRELARRL